MKLLSITNGTTKYSTNPDLFIKGHKWPAFSINTHTYPICPQSNIKMLGYTQHLHTHPPLPRTSRVDTPYVEEVVEEEVKEPEIDWVEVARLAEEERLRLEEEEREREWQLTLDEIIRWIAKETYWCWWRESRTIIMPIILEILEACEWDLMMMGILKIVSQKEIDEDIERQRELEAQRRAEEEGDADVTFAEEEEVYIFDDEGNCHLQTAEEKAALNRPPTPPTPEPEISDEDLELIREEHTREVLSVFDEFLDEITREPTREPTPEPEPELELVPVFVPNPVSMSPVMLGYDPTGLHTLYCVGKDVVIRPIGNAGLLTLYTEHKYATTVARFSPAAQYVASADAGGLVRIWDATGSVPDSLKYEYKVLHGPIRDLCWSNCGTMICVVGDGLTESERHGDVICWVGGHSVATLDAHSEEGVDEEYKIRLGGVRDVVTDATRENLRHMTSCQFRPGLSSATKCTLVTAGADGAIAIYTGPPFLEHLRIQRHEGVVNCVCYSHQGDKLASAGVDHKIFVYEAESGDVLTELTRGRSDPAHDLSVTQLCFSPNDMRILSTSEDCTVKIWNLTTNAVFDQFTMASAQLGCMWLKRDVTSITMSGNERTDMLYIIITVSQTGTINYIDLDYPGAPVTVLGGHKAPVQALVVCGSVDRHMAYTGCRDGQVVFWEFNGELDTWTALPLEGVRHQEELLLQTPTSEDVDELAEAPEEGECQEKARTARSYDGVSDISFVAFSTQGDTLVSCGADQMLTFTSIRTNRWTQAQDHAVLRRVSLPAPPVGVASWPHTDLSVVCCADRLLVLRAYDVIHTQMLQYEAAGVALHPALGRLAVAETMDRVHVYSWREELPDEGGVSLCEVAVLGVAMGARMMALAYSPLGAWLGVGDGYGGLTIFSEPDLKPCSHYVHNDTVTCLAFSPNERRVVTGSTDTTTGLVVWDLACMDRRTVVRNPHAASTTTRLAWLTTTELLSTASDGSLRTFRVV